MTTIDGSLALAETLLRYSMHNKPSSIAFPITETNLSLITLAIHFDEYRGLALLYGRPFVEQVIQYFEDLEEYEICGYILRQLNDLHFELNFLLRLMGAGRQVLALQAA
jgi:nitrate reductase beta subunit